MIDIKIGAAITLEGLGALELLPLCVDEEMTNERNYRL